MGVFIGRAAVWPFRPLGGRLGAASRLWRSRGLQRRRDALQGGGEQAAVLPVGGALGVELLPQRGYQVVAVVVTCIVMMETTVVVAMVVTCIVV